MLERLLLLSTLAGLVTTGALAARAFTARRTRRLQAGPAPLSEALGERADGRPTIVLFSTPSCAVCRSAQLPALRLVQQKLGEPSVRIVNIDASAHPDLVKVFRVMTAPTTILFSADGQLSAYNHGFATADRLIQQLENPFGTTPTGTVSGMRRNRVTERVCKVRP